MLTELFQKSTLFSRLIVIDKKFAEETRKAGCPYCGGPLRFSNYLRKPRGGPAGLPDEYCVRFSLCCGREKCRRRTIPPSCRFNGRRVYWHAVMLVAMSLRQGASAGKTLGKLQKLFGMARNTLVRWIAWYREVFPSTATWRRVRGQVSPVVRNDGLPANLVNHCISRFQSTAPADGLISCLKLLSGA